MYIFLQDSRLRKYLTISQVQAWRRNTNTVGNVIRALSLQERSKNSAQKRVLQRQEKLLREGLESLGLTLINISGLETVTGKDMVPVSPAGKPIRLTNSMRDITGRPVSIQRSDLMNEMSMLNADLVAIGNEAETLQNMVTTLKERLEKKSSRTWLKSGMKRLSGLYRSLKGLLRFIKRNAPQS